MTGEGAKQPFFAPSYVAYQKNCRLCIRDEIHLPSLETLKDRDACRGGMK